MTTIYFDTETTALIPGQICQLAYILETDSGLQSKCFFFCVDSIDPKAAEITGFSVERLAILSGGRCFKDDIEEIATDFSRAGLIVAHNIRFDESFMRVEFERQCKRFCYKDKLCSMQYFTKILKLPSKRGFGYKLPSLLELANYYGVDEASVTELTQSLFDASVVAHDARYDTVKMYLALKKARETNIYIESIFAK